LTLSHQDIGIEKEKIVVIAPPPCVEKKWEADCNVNGIVFSLNSLVFLFLCKDQK